MEKLKQNVHILRDCSWALVELLCWAGLKDGTVKYTRENMGFKIR